MAVWRRGSSEHALLEGSICLKMFYFFTLICALSPGVGKLYDWWVGLEQQHSWSSLPMPGLACPLTHSRWWKSTTNFILLFKKPGKKTGSCENQPHLISVAASCFIFKCGLSLHRLCLYFPFRPRLYNPGCCSVHWCFCHFASLCIFN